MATDPRDLKKLVDTSLDAGDATGWFEPLYASADGDPEAIPWARRAPHPMLVNWLGMHLDDANGANACVVGCGLGDDAEELAKRGFDVTAFDVSETAVRWAKERFPTSKVDYRVIDLFDLPEDWHHGFGFVFESRTVQSLPEETRDRAMHAVASLVAPGGSLLAFALLATSNDIAKAWDGPPWALAPSELSSYRAAGLSQGALEHPKQPNEHGAMEVRMLWHRPAPEGTEQV